MPGMIGQRIGAYEIVALLGKGGMAEVYRARQQLGGRVARDVALKLIDARLSLSPEFIARFEREAQTLVSLSHPHILKAFDYGQYQDTVYLVMELLPGGSLAELIRKCLLPLSDVTRLLEQTGQALDYAHRQSIVHRDLKPQNVLLDSESNAFLTDFGIVKLLGETSSLTQSNTSIGTPAYMAPEQWTAGAVDARTDLYALGVMLYEMVGGRVPFSGDTPFRVMYLHTHESPPSIYALRPDLPPTIDRVIGKALAKDPAARYESAAALVADFKAALAGHPVTAPPATLLPPTPAVPSLASVSSPLPNAPTYVSVPPTGSSASSRHLSPVLAIAAALIIAAIVGTGLLAILSNHAGPTPISSNTSSPTQAIAFVPTQTLTAIQATATASATFTSIPPMLVLTNPPVPTNTDIPTSVPTQLLAPTLTVIDTITAPPTELVQVVIPTTMLPTNTPTRTAIPTENRTATVGAAKALTMTNITVAAATRQAIRVASYTRTFTITPTWTFTPTPTRRPTASATYTVTSTPTQTFTPIPTITPTVTSADTPVPTETNTPLPTATNTPLPTSSPSPTLTLTPPPTVTQTPSLTGTNTPSPTDTPISTETNTLPATVTPAPTATDVPSPTDMPVSTDTSTSPPTETPVPSATDTPFYNSDSLLPSSMRVIFADRFSHNSNNWGTYSSPNVGIVQIANQALQFSLQPNAYLEDMVPSAAVSVTDFYFRTLVSYVAPIPWSVTSFGVIFHRSSSGFDFIDIRPGTCIFALNTFSAKTKTYTTLTYRYGCQGGSQLKNLISFKLTIIAKNNQYAVYIDNTKEVILNDTLKLYTSGQLGVYASSAPASSFNISFTDLVIAQ